jgi:hypothetical protein
MPNSSDQADLSLGSGYAAALESLRSTAKWLLTAFAGIAAALTAGLQLTGIGELSPTSWRLWVAIASIGAALAALGFMASSASAVLARDWVTLNAFTGQDIASQFEDAPGHTRRRHFDDVALHIEDNRHELYGHVAPDVATLHRKLREANEQIHASTEPAARDTAIQQAAELRGAAREVVQCANYYSTLELFQRMKTRLIWASLVAAVALGTFAYAANPPKYHDPVDVRVRLISPAARSAPPSAVLGSKRLSLACTQHIHEHDSTINVVLLDLELVHRAEDDQVADGQQHGAEPLRRHAHSHDQGVVPLAEGRFERIGQFLPLSSPHFFQELLG